LPDADPPPDALRHRDLLVATVREAGQLALQAFGQQPKTWTKDGGSPVSEADLAVNALLHDRLRPAAPDVGWLSEESIDEPKRLTTPHVWIVDPIDGTRAFLAQWPDWCVSVALVADGRPVLAAVYVPVADEMFVAVRGAGATLNGARLHITDAVGLEGARAAGPQRFLRALAPSGIAPVPRVNSLALRLARVAQGTLEVAFAFRDSHDWDLAAADLLVHEAGGVMTTFAGSPVIYNRVDPVHDALIAAGRRRHATVLGVIKDQPAAFA